MTPDLEPCLEEAQNTFQGLEATDAITFALFRQAPSQGYGRLAVERSQVILRSPFMDNDLVKLVYRAPPHLLKGEKLSTAVISRNNLDLLNISTDRGLLGKGPRFKNMIREVYRRILIKAEYLSSHGVPNWLPVIAHFDIGGFLEKSFVGRDKFQHFHRWTRRYFSEYVTDVVLPGSKDLKEFFNPRTVENIVREHLSGRQNHTDDLDKLITLSLTYKNLLKRPHF